MTRVRSESNDDGKEGESLKKKIYEIKQALGLRAYNSALALVLTLPSICAKVEFDDIKEDSRKYIAWFNKYATNKFTFKTNRIPDGKPSEFITIDGDTCYKLRCAVLHAGNFETHSCKYSKITIHGHDQNGEFFEHEKYKDGIANIDINKFCDLLCSAVEEYYDSFEDKSKFNIDNVLVLDW